MALRYIDSLDLAGTRTFIRADFNVPLKNGAITDATRIEAALPTIQWAVAQGAHCILASHLGRPKNGPDATLSLRPVAEHLADLIHLKVRLAPDCVGPDVERMTRALDRKEILLLENLRFHPEEEKNDPGFAKQLAALADVYVNDAFGAAHRAHASTEGMARLVPVRAAGFLMKKEVEALSKVTQNPERPLVAILGGAKVSDKIKIIEHLLTKVDTLLIGGAMAYTFLRAQGHATGDSLVENDCVEVARTVLARAKERGTALRLPIDHLVSTALDGSAAAEMTVDIPPGKKGVDIGPASIALYRTDIAGARTIFWNGPMGIFEVDAFSAGTMAIAEAMADSKALTVVGGGDSIAALARSGRSDDITHISTGGGASLEFLEGRELPRIGGARTMKKTTGRRPLLAGNWKMHATRPETTALIDGIKGAAASARDRDVVIAPPFTALETAARLLAGTSIGLAAQNIHTEPKGAFTGEIAGDMLKDVGCGFVIIGHSERRQYFNETNEMVRQKIAAAIRSDLKAIVCIGETLREREGENTLPIIERQVREGLAGLSREAVRSLVIAYEPVWAIGTGKTATPEQAEEVHALIRSLLKELVGDNGAEAVRILYGGSVKADNIDALMAQPNIDGALVGGASLDAASFSRIIAFQ